MDGGSIKLVIFLGMAMEATVDWEYYLSEVVLDMHGGSMKHFSSGK